MLTRRNLMQAAAGLSAGFFGGLFGSRRIDSTAAPVEPAAAARTTGASRLPSGQLTDERDALINCYHELTETNMWPEDWPRWGVGPEPYNVRVPQMPESALEAFPKIPGFVQVFTHQQVYPPSLTVSALFNGLIMRVAEDSYPHLRKEELYQVAEEKSFLGKVSRTVTPRYVFDGDDLVRDSRPLSLAILAATRAILTSQKEIRKRLDLFQDGLKNGRKYYCVTPVDAYVARIGYHVDFFASFLYVGYAEYEEETYASHGSALWPDPVPKT